jgi:hypothetical protein
MLSQKKYPSSINLRPRSSPAKVSHATKRVTFILATLIMSGCVIFFFQYRADMKTEYDSTLPKTEAEALSREVGMVVLVPEGEIPSVAHVEDPEKLAGQEFFARAQAGDKVLVYAKAKKAILYRPAEKRVIEMMPFEPSEGTR